MIENQTPEESAGSGTAATAGRRGRAAVGIGLVAAGALAGAVLAGTMSASADSTSTPTASSSSSTGYGSGEQKSGTKGSHGADGTRTRSDEKELTGETAQKVKDAALKAVPGATVIRVETDADGATYEAHLKKADGTVVTVKLDANFAVTATQEGYGAGGRGAKDGSGHKGGKTKSGATSGATPSATSSATATPSTTAS